MNFSDAVYDGNPNLRASNNDTILHKFNHQGHHCQVRATF